MSTLPEDLIAEAREFVLLREKIEQLTNRQNEIKKSLMAATEAHGEVDDKGHYWLDLPKKIRGIVRFQRQRRITRKLDEPTAIEILSAKGLKDRCMPPKPVLDEDEVMACLYENLLTPEDIDRIWPTTVSWAFVAKDK